MKIGSVILVEAGLEFLGLGSANNISWGYMMHNGQHFMRNAWWMIAFPSLAISLLLLAVNLVGDELNRMLNPRLRLWQVKEPL
jgi:peptide/nickel transport system permease protein